MNENIKRETRDLAFARRFFNTYLDSTIKVIDQYVQLSDQGIKSENVTGVLEKFEEKLDTIVMAYQKQLEHLLSNDVLEMGVEISVLDSVIRSEMK